MARITTLSPLLAPARLNRGIAACRRRQLTALLAWGNKPSGRLAERVARSRNLPLWRCEDGFLRSLGLGGDAPPLSILLDDLGIYYDAARPSRLESLIAAPLDGSGRRRAAALAGIWRQERLSKYNGAPESPAPDDPFVLVVDQTAGDLSIRGGLADAASFAAMLQTARQDHPHCRLLLRLHPDVVRGRRRGHFSEVDMADPRLMISADGGHPVALLEQAEAVYVVTSQLGFEALLWGKPVHCFGMPFYAGWGLTHDVLAPPARRQGGSDRERLIHAALIDYPRYLDPHRGVPCEPERLMKVIGLQQRCRRELPERIEAFGFKPWKQPILRRFLAGSRIRFRRRNACPSIRARTLAIWGRQPGRGVARRLAAAPAPALLHIEDGFLRSVGLGANLIAPVSWVIDRRGMYYDAGAPSDLEVLLAHHPFTDAERHRAAELRQRLLAAAITKYNLAAPTWQRPASIRRVVLVVGQVEGDASIQLGSPDLRTNRQLLAAVRRAEPDAWLLYKPHPDVVAGLRQGNPAEIDAAGLCDELVVEAAMEPLYASVDAVHVLTSLAGFEALLRGRKVHTWGLPFYAGWGLTHDRHCCGRRNRTLRLEELVHASLIAYPRYVSRRSGLFVEPEEAIEELADWYRGGQTRLRSWQRIFRRWGQLRERFMNNFRAGRES